MRQSITQKKKCNNVEARLNGFEIIRKKKKQVLVCDIICTYNCSSLVFRKAFTRGKLMVFFFNSVDLC